eukprot:Gb_10975 [translate_table: standard]
MFVKRASDELGIGRIEHGGDDYHVWTASEAIMIVFGSKRWRSCDQNQDIDLQSEECALLDGSIPAVKAANVSHRADLIYKDLVSKTFSEIISFSKNAEKMDMLWEQFNDAPGKLSDQCLINTHKITRDDATHKLGSLQEKFEFDGEFGHGEVSQSCCQKPFMRNSTARNMPLPKPKPKPKFLGKISKALRLFGVFNHFRSKQKSA